MICKVRDTLKWEGRPLGTNRDTLLAVQNLHHRDWPYRAAWPSLGIFMSALHSNKDFLGQEVAKPSNVMCSAELRVTIKAVTTEDDVMEDWHGLSLQAASPFFLSPNWIEGWLTNHALTEPGPVWCARICETDGRLVAMGVFCETVAKRHKFLSVRQLHLHATGNPDKDRITIEYNSLLSAPGYERTAWTALLAALNSGHGPDWDEIALPGITGKLEMILRPLTNSSYRHAEAGSFHVDLTALHKSNASVDRHYISTLSKNSRAQIRRAIKLYAERGPLMIERAQTAAQAHDWFDQMAILHDAKWLARGKISALRERSYNDFHRRLIERGVPTGEVDLLQVNAGESSVGILYNFVWRNEALFYTSGFIGEEDNRMKPGLVSQVLAIEYYGKRGLKAYDFMGGDDRYKASLGQLGPEIITLILQRQRVALWLEGIARKIKASLSR